MKDEAWCFNVSAEDFCRSLMPPGGDPDKCRFIDFEHCP
jgi:hypothetical protein